MLLNNLGSMSVHVVVADMSHEQEVEASVKEAVLLMGGVDILVLNHIIPYFGSWLQSNSRLSSEVQLKTCKRSIF